MKRTEMVMRGAHRLRKAEDAIGNALIEAAGLASELEQLRLQGGVSMMYGQGAMNKIVASITMLSNAREAMIGAHEELSTVKTQLGCGAVAVGNPPKPGDDNGAVIPPSGLQVVAENKAA